MNLTKYGFRVVARAPAAEPFKLDDEVVIEASKQAFKHYLPKLKEVNGSMVHTHEFFSIVVHLVVAEDGRVNWDCFVDYDATYDVGNETGPSYTETVRGSFSASNKQSLMHGLSATAEEICRVLNHAKNTNKHPEVRQAIMEFMR
jgi:hypothetical protein